MTTSPLLGKIVVYHFKKDEDRAAIITKDNGDGSFGLTAFALHAEYLFPFEHGIARFPKVKEGLEIGAFSFIVDKQEALQRLQTAPKHEFKFVEDGAKVVARPLRDGEDFCPVPASWYRRMPPDDRRIYDEQVKYARSQQG